MSEDALRQPAPLRDDRDIAPKSVIRGGGFGNKGAEAMLHTTFRELARRLPDVQFSSVLPVADAQRALESGLEPICSSRTRGRKALTFLHAYATQAATRAATRISPLAAFEMLLAEPFCAVVDISGLGYSDVWGSEQAERGLAWVQRCEDTGRPCVFLPQAWGPFQRPNVAGPIREMCAKADLVYARDQTSYDYLKALMGTGSARVKVAPDIAFRFAGAPPLVGAEILIALGLARGATPILGITPNVRVYERMRGRGTRNAYIRLLADVIRHCLREWDASVVLVPHELTHRVGHHPDDRYLCGMLESMMNDPARVVSMKGDYSAAQLKSVIGNLDLLIGSRFHSLVFALSACTPVISIGWSHKYQELLSPFDLAEFSVDHASSSSGQFLDRLDLAWEQREKTRRHIGERLPNLLERVDAVFDETADLLRGRLRQSPYTG